MKKLTSKQIYWLTEQLKSARNLTEIGLLIISKHREELLYTVLETLFETSQAILDGYCIKNKNVI